MDLEQRRELNNGFGDSLAKAVELTLTPAIFGFLGHLLDNRLGTSPLFLLLFALFTFGYVCWKSWGSYERRMQEHEAKLHVTPGSHAMTDDAPVGAPELDIARDLVRRAIPLGIVLIVVSGLIWGSAGAWTSAFAMAIVTVNLLVAAGLMAWAARISPTVLMGAVMGGFLVRMAVVTLAIYAVKDASWVELPLLAFTVLLAQLGLLFWETRYVSGSLAFPGLKPGVAVSKEARPS